MIRLLLIDDDVSLTTLLAEYLQNDGFHLTVVNDGITGLRYCQQQQFELIILDVMMPGLDGWEVLRMLRAARFISLLEVAPDPSITAAVTAMADRLTIVSAERVRIEFDRLMTIQ